MPAMNRFILASNLRRLATLLEKGTPIEVVVKRLRNLADKISKTASYQSAS